MEAPESPGSPDGLVQALRHMRHHLIIKFKMISYHIVYCFLFNEVSRRLLMNVNDDFFARCFAKRYSSS